MNTRLEPNSKPMDDRQRDVDEKIKAKIGPENYDLFQKMIRHDAVQWTAIPLLLGREVWELFWGVYRDSIELNADRVLSAKEKSKASPPSIFDGLR